MHISGYRFSLIITTLLLCMWIFGGCASNAASPAQIDSRVTSSDAASSEQTDSQTFSQDVADSAITDYHASSWAAMEPTGHMPLDYATEFAVDYYDGLALITIGGTDRYLLIPENAKAPADLDTDIIPIRKPDTIYLAASAGMDYFRVLKAFDTVRMTSTQAVNWSLPEVVQALDSEKMLYAGKYSAPDYELLLREGIDLAIESTMIYHTPEVMEMIQDLGMPVIVDRSSYESNPLGRTEWIKLYSVIVDHEEEAETFFKGQIDTLKELEDFPNTEKTVAFFYFTTDGKVVVRASTDYIPTMIEMGGGRYIFKGVTDESGSVSVGLTLEKFYDIAKDVDYIVYNGSIDTTVKNLDSLLAKNELLKEFKAYKDGNCWLSTGAMYQRTDLAADMIMDFHKLVTGDTGDMHFLEKLD